IPPQEMERLEDLVGKGARGVLFDEDPTVTLMVTRESIRNAVNNDMRSMTNFVGDYDKGPPADVSLQKMIDDDALRQERALRFFQSPSALGTEYLPDLRRGRR